MMRTKRDIVLRALERGIEVSLRENRYMLDENGKLGFLISVSSDNVNWEENLYLSDCSFNYFTEMCDELDNQRIVEICFSTAMVEINAR